MWARMNGPFLSRPAEQISFGEIVRSMEGPIALVSCASVNFYAPCGDCHDEARRNARRRSSRPSGNRLIPSEWPNGERRCVSTASRSPEIEGRSSVGCRALTGRP